MILQKKTINNVPTLVPLTADTGSGVPVGTIIGQYKKVNMAGYLYLDGSTFDQTLYPALYAYLGTNVLPDYREFVLVGAEQNTTSATIADHDVFTQGQEKDDQIQEHIHNMEDGSGTPIKTGPYGNNGGNTHVATVSSILTDPAYAKNISSGRHGTTTRTKEKAVFWYIKATTGIIESEATEMLNVINENNSYSLNEVATGKTWIDGKPIYRKTFHYDSISVAGDYKVMDNVDNLVDQGGGQVYSGAERFHFPWSFYNKSNDEVERLCFIIKSDNGLYRRINYVNLNKLTDCNWWVEYTKTTD